MYKLRNYVVSFAEDAKEKAGHSMMRLASVTGISSGMLMVPTIAAYAAEGDVSGSNLLTGDVWSAILSGFGDLGVTCTQILAISCVTGIGIVGMTSAAKYAMKKIKTTLASAA